MPLFFGPAASGSGSFDEFLARYLQGQHAAHAGRPIDITRLLSRRSHELLAGAAQFAVELGHTEVDALHILRVLVEQDPAAAHLKQAGADPAAIARAAEQRLPGKSAEKVEAAPSLTPSAQRALLDAYQVARAFGSTYVDPEHLFFAFVLNQEAPAGQLLAAAGITPQSLQQAGLREPAQPAARRSPAPDSATPMLDQFGIDLTARASEGKLDPVIGRADEI